MLLLRFVAFALLPKPMISAVRIALLPLPFWPTNKFVRALKSTVRFEWHMKFRNFTVNILPLRTPKSNSPKSAVELAIDIPIPSSYDLVHNAIEQIVSTIYWLNIIFFSSKISILYSPHHLNRHYFVLCFCVHALVYRGFVFVSICVWPFRFFLVWTTSEKKITFAFA